MWFDFLFALRSLVSDRMHCERLFARQRGRRTAQNEQPEIMGMGRYTVGQTVLWIITNMRE